MRCFCLALRNKQQQTALPTCEAWGCALAQAAGDNSELRDILGVFTSMLVSETSCERNFSLDRHQHRPRLSDAMRFAGLKTMVDGFAVEKLQGMGGQLQIFGRRFTFQSDLSCKPYDCDFDFVVLVFAPKIAQRGAAPVC